MIREIATLSISPDSAEAFEAAVALARPLFLEADGCRAMHLERVIETPGIYRLIAVWKSVDHHTELFRNSPAFAQWRALAAPFFVSPPSVVHSVQVVG